MPEKYELFLDKNKKVKLAADEHGNFFAEANGKRIKLGENGLEAIGEGGIPEAIGGAVDFSAIDQSIIPDTNEAYDLGTAEKKFRDLYLSSGTLYLGDESLSSTEAVAGKTAAHYGDYQVLAERLDLNGNPEIIDITDLFKLNDNPADPYASGAYSYAYYEPGKNSALRTSGYWFLAAANTIFHPQDTPGSLDYATYNSIFTKIIFNIYNESTSSINWLETLEGFEMDWIVGGAPNNINLEFNYYKKQKKAVLNGWDWYNFAWVSSISGNITVNYLSGVGEVLISVDHASLYNKTDRDIHINLNSVDFLQISVDTEHQTIYDARNLYISSRGYDWVQEALNSITSLGTAGGHYPGNYWTSAPYWLDGANESYSIPIQNLKDAPSSFNDPETVGYMSEFYFPIVFTGANSKVNRGITVDPNIDDNKLIELCRIASKRNGITSIWIQWPYPAWNSYYNEFQYGVTPDDPTAGTSAFVADNTEDFLSRVLTAFDTAFNPSIPANSSDLGNGSSWSDYAPEVWVMAGSNSYAEFLYWSGDGLYSNSGVYAKINQIQQFTAVTIIY